MKYRIQNTNYRDFEIYEQHKRAPRAYFIPYANEETLRGTPASRERYSSDLVQVLSGQWGFRYYSDSRDLPKEFDSSSVKFDEITVPSTWQRAAGGKYEPPVYLNVAFEFDNTPPELPEKVSCGVYRKRFKLSEVEGRNFIISFLGVIASLDLYCNGYHVGYSEGAHNTAEFDLSSIVRNGENEIVAVVHKWSSGTFLECQDMFRDNGIFRDVLLYILPKTYLNDFWLRPQKQADGSYKLNATVEVQGEQLSGWSVELSIEGLDVKTSGAAKERMNLSLDKLNVTQWNAEQPVLYTAWIKLVKSGQLSQVVRVPIGFKSIEINRNLFYFNDKLIKFKGVNHHDTNPKTGYCMTYEDYVRDLTLMKQFNVNTIRTSHYPPDPHLLMLANEMGFYVIDEADIEAHGCCRPPHNNYDLIAQDKTWIPRFLDRVKRMLFRDRNNVCITMWSLGNEAGGHHCPDACYAFLHAVNPEIPVHYEGVMRHENVRGYDVYSEMYTHLPLLEQYAAAGDDLPEKIRQAPFFLCEYVHAMGVGPGCFEEYWQLIYAHDHLTGGCVWEWADHAAYHESGPYKFTYGGDHGESRHDGNFCVDGLFYPDRRPHTGAYAMKNIYRPVRAKKSGNGILFTNTNRFANEACALRWEFLHNGIVIESGAYDLDIPALASFDMPLALPALGAGDYHLSLYYGEDIAFEQLTLQEEYIPEQLQSGNDLGEVLATLQPNFLRAWLDNDNWRNWPNAEYQPHNLIVKGDGVYADEDKQFSIDITTEQLCGGAVKITGKLTPGEDMLEDLQIPRFGVRFKLPGAWDQVKYYGLGEKENLCDFKEHAKIGIYQAKVGDMHEPYVKPQDNGNHGEVRWLEITDAQGRGLRIANAPGKLSFSAHRYSQESLMAAGHDEDLRDEGAVFLSVDGFMRGTGSSACGPDTLDEYKLDLTHGLEFSFEIVMM